MYQKGRAGIPNNTTNVQIRIFIAAHCGIRWHKGIYCATNAVWKEIISDGMVADFKELITGCIHCLTSRTHDNARSSLSSTAHSSYLNQQLQFDYLHIGIGIQVLKFLIVLKDDFSGYSWISPNIASIAEHVSNCIANWIDTFYVMAVCRSNQGAHFRNDVINLLATQFGIYHHLTTTNSPGAKGTVVRLNLEVIRSLKNTFRETYGCPWMAEFCFTSAARFEWIQTTSSWMTNSGDTLYT